MPDWNLALIDVAAAWVVVALPRYVQARILAASRVLSEEQKHLAAVPERNLIDPTKHTSILGTLLVPALCSLAGIPVLAWGKAWDLPPLARPALRLGLRLVLATVLAYLLQALLFAFLMIPLSWFYLAGAPVAARAGQLCARLALINLTLLPALDAGVIWQLLPLPQRLRPPFHWGLSAVAFALLLTTPALRLVDRAALLAFFDLSQRLRAFLPG